jgi:hypothetical protein
LHELAERYEALQKSKLPAEIQAQLADQQRSLDVLHAQLEAMQQSKTWRLANLFRQVYRALRSLLPRS